MENEEGTGDAEQGSAKDEGEQAPDPSELQKKIAELEAINEKLKAQTSKANKEAADRRIKLREKEQAERALLEEQGKFKDLWEKIQKENSELSAHVEKLSGIAERYQAWQEREAERVEARAKDAPEFVRKAIAKMSAVEDKAEILDEWMRSSGKENGTSGPPPGPPSTNKGATPTRYVDMTPEQRREARSGASKKLPRSSLA